MAIVNCIYRAVTLQAGESFVLPPGAELLGVSDIGNITSTCNTDNLEEALCYTMEFGVSENESSSPVLEDNDYNLYFVVDGTEYQIINELGAGGLSVWLTNASPIVAAIPPGIITNPVLTNSDTGDRHTATFTFSAIPSLASVIRIKIVGPGYGGGLYVYPTEVDC